MKKPIQWLIWPMVLVFAGIVCAGDLTDRSFEKLMDLSGLNQQMVEIPGMIVAGIGQARKQGPPISDKEFEEMQGVIKGAFQSSEILKTIGKEIKNNLSESEVKELLVWYESDLGIMITKSEKEASTPFAYQEMFRDAGMLLADEKRVTIAKKIDKLVNSTDMALQLQNNTGIAIFSAISTVMNPGQPTNLDVFKAQMAAQENQMRAEMEQIIILSSVYSYQNIEIDQMEKYIQFLERPHTIKFNNSVIKGMKTALNRSIDKLATSLAVVFKKNAGKIDK
ncbi:MAG: hypothetical protein KJ737_27560 [Proteobacteria bacterium]|nr:hypothetical protein [Pseudomonadota bacterium]